VPAAPRSGGPKTGWSCDVHAKVSNPDSGALIGPNAVLQTVAAMEARLGRAETRAILDDAQIDALPSGDHMIPEAHALRLHRWLALHEPLGSFTIAEDAGARTADYIIANRIPRPAVWLLRHLPASAAAPLLMAAIRKHAWTFIGAGQFADQHQRERGRIRQGGIFSFRCGCHDLSFLFWRE